MAPGKYMDESGCALRVPPHGEVADKFCHRAKPVPECHGLKPTNEREPWTKRPAIGF